MTPEQIKKAIEETLEEHGFGEDGPVYLNFKVNEVWTCPFCPIWKRIEGALLWLKSKM